MNVFYENTKQDSVLSSKLEEFNVFTSHFNRIRKQAELENIIIFPSDELTVLGLDSSENSKFDELVIKYRMDGNIEERGDNVIIHGSDDWEESPIQMLLDFINLAFLPRLKKEIGKLSFTSNYPDEDTNIELGSSMDDVIEKSFGGVLENKIYPIIFEDSLFRKTPEDGMYIDITGEKESCGDNALFKLNEVLDEVFRAYADQFTYELIRNLVGPVFKEVLMQSIDKVFFKMKGSLKTSLFFSKNLFSGVELKGYNLRSKLAELYIYKVEDLIGHRIHFEYPYLK